MYCLPPHPLLHLTPPPQASCFGRVTFDVFSSEVRQNVIFVVMSEVQKDSENVSAGKYLRKIHLKSFPAIWGQSRRGRLWPQPVQVGLTCPLLLASGTVPLKKNYEVDETFPNWSGPWREAKETLRIYDYKTITAMAAEVLYRNIQKPLKM